MPNFEPKLIGKKIRELRLMKGYKQEYMAYKVGITQTGYSKIETGETSLSLERAGVIANAFEMSLVELIQWEIEA